MTKREPQYHTYFTQSGQAERERLSALLESTKGSFSSREELNDHYGGYYEWPADMREQYDKLGREHQEKVAAIASTGQENKCSDITLYIDCSDGNHYFSTPYYNYGSIEKAELDADNSIQFDHIDTAVYAFLNDWKDWEKTHGEAQRKKDKLLMLEALRADTQANTTDTQSTSNQSCEHEDLGSLGYKHGDTVICPNCGLLAEVW